MSDKPVIALGSCILKEEAASRDREVQRPVGTQGGLAAFNTILQKRPPIGRAFGRSWHWRGRREKKSGFLR